MLARDQVCIPLLVLSFGNLAAPWAWGWGGTDEVPTCMPGEFRCHDDYSCVPSRWRCDGAADCQDHSDEHGCANPESCNRHQGYAWCTNQVHCYHFDVACNGVEDCPDGSDEGGSCTTKCSRGQCGESCHETPQGPTCSCPVGYILESDNTTCTDVDECVKMPPPCSQRCDNSLGGYSCSCQSGYVLDDDEHRCHAAGETGAELLVASKHDIISISLVTKLRRHIQQGLKKTLDITYDKTDGKIYWIDDNVIRSSTFHGSGETDVVNTGLLMPRGVAVDWIGRLLYMTDAQLQKVIACTLDGSMCTFIIEDEIEHPVSIVLCSVKGQFYWSETRSHPRIEASSLDGHQRSSLVISDIHTPIGLALDEAMDKLYWVDHGKRTVESIKLDGTERMVHLEKEALEPVSLTIFEDTIYWADWAARHIDSAHKITGKQHHHLLEIARPVAVRIHHEIFQKGGTNYCHDSPCSHMCLLNAVQSYTCACPQGMLLRGDRHTCIDDGETSYLLLTRITELLRVHPQRIGTEWSTVEPVFLGLLSEVGDIAFDPATGNLIYTNILRKAIMSAPLNQTTEGTILADGRIGSPLGVAVDWVNRNVYWTDDTKGLVEVYSLVTRARVTLTETGLFAPHGIDVDAVHGHLFIADWGDRHEGPDPCLYRCDMLADNCEIIVPDTLPTSIQYDADTDRIYWTDSHAGLIESARTDGTERFVITRSSPHPFALAIMNDTLYWTEILTPYIHSCDKYDGSNVKMMYTGFGVTGMRGAVVIGPVQHTTELNACSTGNGGCSHVCIPTGSSRVCLCSEDTRLEDDEKTCKKFCPSDRFQCDDVCLHPSQVCDGEADCAHAEDEDEDACIEKRCPEGFIPCPDKVGGCVEPRQICDGISQCRDDADEQDCPDPNCDPETEFPCIRIRQCIDVTYHCDMEEDCIDGSDEECHDNTCPNTYFRCHTGRCIPGSWLCDGDEDCDDGEDEPDKCNNTVINRCEADEWHCTSGECVQKELLCDGQAHCSDGSDEEGELCGVSARPDGICTENQFHCYRDSADTVPVCIPESAVCDRSLDCSGGEDEDQCDYPTCPENQFRCLSDDQCIPESAVCDNRYDCQDLSDETAPKCLVGGENTDGADANRNSMLTIRPRGGSRMEKCESDEYKCSLGECIPLEQLCDGTPHCTAGNDEGPMCGSACSLNNGGCSWKCVPSPLRPLCLCEPGYTLLDDGKTCADDDECAKKTENKKPLCDQRCVNYPGGYKCECRAGYQLESDHSTCKAAGLPPSVIYISKSVIYNQSLHTGHLHILKDVSFKVIDVEYDLKNGFLYWARQTYSKGVFAPSLLQIEKFEIATGAITTVADEVPHCHGIALDWLTGTLYYTSTYRIVACRKNEATNKEQCILVLYSDVLQPWHIVVNPPQGLMFWTEQGRYHSHLFRAFLDGTNVKKLIPSGGGMWQPQGLAIDPAVEQLYWVDSRTEAIYSCDFDGQRMRILLEGQHNGIVVPSGVTVFQDEVYWSDSRLGRITKVNKYSGKRIKIVRSNLLEPKAVKVMHLVQQPDGTNYCRNKDHLCDGLCLLKPEGSTCRCPIGETPSKSDANKCTFPATSPTPPSSPSPLATVSVDVDIVTLCAPGLCGRNTSCVIVNETYTCRCSKYSDELVPCKNLTAAILTERSSSPRPKFVAITTMVCVLILTTFGTLGAMLYCRRQRRVHANSATVTTVHYRGSLLRQQEDQQARGLFESEFENPCFDNDGGPTEIKRGKRYQRPSETSGDSIDSALTSSPESLTDTRPLTHGGGGPTPTKYL